MRDYDVECTLIIHHFDEALSRLRVLHSDDAYLGTNYCWASDLGEALLLNMGDEK